MQLRIRITERGQEIRVLFYILKNNKIVVLTGDLIIIDDLNEIILSDDLVDNR